LNPLRVRRLSILGGAVALLCLAAAATAAAPPLPKTAMAYSTSGFADRVSFTLVTSPSNPKRIEKGVAAAGSQFALSGGAVQCPKAKKNAGFHEVPFAIFGFPGVTLKLKNGTYAFSKKIRRAGTVPLGSSGTGFVLKVTLTGNVVSPTLIEGTVEASGGVCTMKKPANYKAKLDPQLPVAPGQ
jgi:hypothetical protein